MVQDGKYVIQGGGRRRRPGYCVLFVFLSIGVCVALVLEARPPLQQPRRDAITLIYRMLRHVCTKSTVCVVVLGMKKIASERTCPSARTRSVWNFDIDKRFRRRRYRVVGMPNADYWLISKMLVVYTEKRKWRVDHCCHPGAHRLSAMINSASVESALDAGFQDRKAFYVDR